MDINNTREICSQSGGPVRTIPQNARMTNEAPPIEEQIALLAEAKSLLANLQGSIALKESVRKNVGGLSDRAWDIWQEEQTKLLRELSPELDFEKLRKELGSDKFNKQWVVKLSSEELARRTLIRLKDENTKDVEILNNIIADYEEKMGALKARIIERKGDIRENYDLFVMEKVNELIQKPEMSISPETKEIISRIKWEEPSQTLVEGAIAGINRALKDPCVALDKMIAKFPKKPKAEGPTNQGPTPPQILEHILDYGFSLVPSYVHTFTPEGDDINSVQIEGRAGLALKIDPVKVQLDYFGYANLEDFSQMNDGIDAARGRDVWAATVNYQDWAFQGTFLMENNVAANPDQQRYLGAGGVGYQFRLGGKNEWQLSPFGGVMGGADITSAADSLAEGILGGYAGGRFANKDLALWTGSPAMGFAIQAVYGNQYNFVSKKDENQVGGMATLFVSPASISALEDISAGPSDFRIGVVAGGGYDLLYKTGTIYSGLLLELGGDVLAPQAVSPGGSF